MKIGARSRLIVCIVAWSGRQHREWQTLLRVDVTATDGILGHQIQFEIMSRVPIDQILELPAAERVELAQQIWESVFDHPEGVLLTTPQREELERRWITFEQNPDEGEPWEDVKRALLDE
jgi:putative addiction module component (TIGR02574 family)